jgi:hypothetical protein
VVERLRTAGWCQQTILVGWDSEINKSSIRGRRGGREPDSKTKELTGMLNRRLETRGQLKLGVLCTGYRLDSRKEADN